MKGMVPVQAEKQDPPCAWTHGEANTPSTLTTGTLQMEHFVLWPPFQIFKWKMDIYPE